MRIALVAMSGVRACDQELLALGLTLPGFVERSRVIASLPSLGLLTLAALTPPGHEVTYLEAPDEAAAAAIPADFDLVAISTFTAQIFEAYALADRLRAAGTTVVIGGLHATVLPEEVLEHADAVIVGEGEPVWQALLADASRGLLRRRYRATQEFDLADAPLPAFELLDIPRYNRLTVQTSRGCPWRCDFCASSVLLTPRYKQKPIERVLAEIDRIRELWPRPFIEFADDNSVVNRGWWRAFLPALARRRVKWFTETDVSVGADDELLGLMRDAGCVEVLVGLESPDETGLAGLELRSDFKRRQASDCRRLVANIQAHGIRVNGCFILGLDGHTPAVFDRVHAFVEELELFDVQITYPTPFPGTPLHERLHDEGRLLEDRAWHKCTLFDIMFEPRPMTVEELRRGFMDLARRLYSEEFTRSRRERFHRRWTRSRAGRGTAAADPPPTVTADADLRPRGTGAS